MSVIVLPFPPAELSGHAKGNSHWRKSHLTAKTREETRLASLGYARTRELRDGDINVHVTFYPPDRRGDRVNFPNRMKPIFDGLADALGVNDARFVPHFCFCKPEKPGRLEIRIGQ